MAFDGITTRAVIAELQKQLIGGKVNKVFQPTKHEIVLSIYNRANYMLLLSASPDECRLHLTKHTKPNPQNAPNFCMLLRKYLVGGKIVDISNYDLERTVQIKLECYNELNDLVVRKLLIQIMSRQSNLILTNENNVIIDSLKHSDDCLPAHPYEFVKISKKSFLELESEQEFLDLVQNQNLVSCLPNLLIGFSKTFVKATLEILQKEAENVSKADLKQIYQYLKSVTNSFGTPNICVKQFEKEYAIVQEEQAQTINEALDEIYFEKEQKSAFLSSRRNLLQIVSGNLRKVYKKLENINRKLKECENMEMYRIYGELLTANLYKINVHENLNEITLPNYYDNNNLLTIPLDHKVNVQKNIQQYFKKYNKLKNALVIVGQQKKEAEKEVDYIESIVFSLENAKSIDDIVDVYAEISENVMTKKEMARKQKNKVSKKKTKEKEIILQSQEIGGFTVYVGKNNVQNDYLSIKFAGKNDIWFHTQKIHGSHILLRNPEDLEVPEEVLLSCAQLAKENSKGKMSSNVAVDYCKAKYVKKSPGAKPGFVIYTNYKTIFVK